MLSLLREYITVPLKKNTFLLNVVTQYLYCMGYVSYRVHQLLRKPYFGFYLFSNQDNFRGRQNVIIETAKTLLFKKEQINILEIGVYCGQTTVALGSLFKYNDKKFIIEAVDPWDNITKGSDYYNNDFYHSYFYKNLKNRKVEDLFDRNIELTNLSKYIKKNKCFSKDFFLQNKKKFDLIIIDASHFFQDVFLDILESKKILNDNGIIIFDDYELEGSKISEAELIRIQNDDVSFFQGKIQFHPGVTLAIKKHFNFDLSVRNGLGIVTLKGREFRDYFGKN